ncbi:catechol 2,3-dioxygenase-like lactoylglutathione lyase family enzyme [Burkholderia ambifaria]|nr:catechol 2,3-dioxygenase-like lactoylglutathione lyase family enzyme [Burkholderia ambifaria]
MDSARSSSGLFYACANCGAIPPDALCQSIPARHNPNRSDYHRRDCHAPPESNLHAHLRIARPVGNLARTERMYRDALELSVLARFEDHDGFSGVMLGREGLDYHFEFTHCPDHPIAPSPTPEDLIVFYLPDRPAWEAACERATAHGFMPVMSFNPYWDISGQTFEDADGYRIVLQNAAWR